MKNLFLTVVFFAMSFIELSAQSNKTPAQNYNLDNGIAIQGYDPVAYFTKHDAVKGNKQFAFTNAGITYYFSSSENRDAFKKDSSRYEPQYGGWCAYAMGAKGEKVNINPETFKIINGKLYLFYNRFFNNTLTTWNKDETSLKAKADENWQKINH